MIVDGNSGVVYVNPGVDVCREYERLAKEYRAFNLRARGDPRSAGGDHRRPPREPLRQHRPASAICNFAREHGAEGVGLYRTEVPFLSHKDFPERGGAGRALSQGRSSAWRGGRSPSARSISAPTSTRAICTTPPGGEPVPRLALDPHLARDAGRSSRRSCAPSCAPARPGRCGMLFPMISSVEEIRRVKELLEEARQELDEAGLPYDRAHADRHHDRGAGGGVPGAAAHRGGRLLQHRHQRPDPVHARRRSQQLARWRRSTSRCIPPCCGAIGEVAQAAKDAGKPVVDVRRDGVRPARARCRSSAWASTTSAWGRSSCRSSSASSARCRSRSPRKWRATCARSAPPRRSRATSSPRLKELGVIELMDIYH